jgi:hypothetical protein
MHRYVQARGTRRASGAEQTYGALHEEAAASRPVAGAPPSQSPQETALMQMRQALDDSPRVKSQLALQRALNRSGQPKAYAPEMPTLQMKGVAVNAGAGAPIAAWGTIQLAQAAPPSKEDPVQKSITNLREYFASIYKHAIGVLGSEQALGNFLKQNNLTIRGHHSGKPGDNMNAATTQDVAEFSAALREYKPAPKDDKKEEKPTKSGQEHTKEQATAHAKKKEEAARKKKVAKHEAFKEQEKAKKGFGSGGAGSSFNAAAPNKGSAAAPRGKKK